MLPGQHGGPAMVQSCASDLWRGQLETAILEIEHTSLDRRALDRPNVLPGAFTPNTAPREAGKLEHQIGGRPIVGITMRLSGDVTKYGQRSENRSRPSLSNERTEDLRDLWETRNIGPKAQHTPSPEHTSEKRAARRSLVGSLARKKLPQGEHRMRSNELALQKLHMNSAGRLARERGKLGADHNGSRRSSFYRWRNGCQHGLVRS